LREKARKLPQSSQASTGVWKSCEEEIKRPGRPESMIRLAVVLVFLIALVGASADLARGRRPVLFA